MKKSSLVISTFMLCAAAMLSSCAKNDAGNAASTAATTTEVADATPSINVRFVNMDSINANYLLARDFQEAQLRAISNLNQAHQQKGNEIQKFGEQIQQKLNNNGYLSEVTLNADRNKLAKMQQDAETFLGNMQRNQEQELAQIQMTLNDSVESFIRDYNATHHYDAILLTAVSLYYNPALDITKEVVEGLNSRYNKVSK